jgi:two-component system phosphate regulon sensor histidine kinase PhoR
VSPRLKLPLALCAVGLIGILIFAMPGLRESVLALLVALAGLFLGQFVAHGAGPTSPTSPRPEPSKKEAGPETKGGAAPASTLLAATMNTLLEATMNGMREGLLVLDESLRVVSANNTARSVFSREGDKLAHEPLSVLTRNPSIHAAYRAALEKGEDSQVKVELLGAERRVFELRVAPLKLDEVHDSRGAIGVFFDITELERLERVRQEFLSNVSHELRTPLTSILAFVETLEDGALHDREHGPRFLSVIRRNAERMHTLIEDIMELSAIESGGTQVDAQQVCLSPLVQEIVTALAAKAEACGVALVNEVSPEANVFADPRRLEQMLLNLVDNAIKFNRGGGVVKISHEQEVRDLISVSDTGEGIPEEYLSRIFERFYRVDRARSREMGGTGLGLAIVKHLARAHGGEVRVRSVPNEGSTFTIELPRDQPNGTSAAR